MYIYGHSSASYVCLERFWFQSTNNLYSKYVTYFSVYCRVSPFFYKIFNWFMNLWKVDIGYWWLLTHTPCNFRITMRYKTLTTSLLCVTLFLCVISLCSFSCAPLQMPTSVSITPSAGKWLQKSDKMQRTVSVCPSPSLAVAAYIMGLAAFSSWHVDL